MQLLDLAITENMYVITVPIGYSDLGYSGRAAYSDLKPNGT